VQAQTIPRLTGAIRSVTIYRSRAGFTTRLRKISLGIWGQSSFFALFDCPKGKGALAKELGSRISVSLGSLN